MGATLTDAGLQAGLNYRKVVFPRVKHLLSVFPEADTTTRFLDLVDLQGINHILRWNHPDKPKRVYDIALLLSAEKIETEEALAEWLSQPGNRIKIQQIPGVGQKTTSYLRKLVGTPAIAVDRHLKTFASWAGVECKKPAELERAFQVAADVMGIDYCSLDHTIWSYMADLKSESLF
jgi:endonuclease III